MTTSYNLAIFGGRKPPSCPGANTMWLSSSPRYIKAPTDAERRTPIIGSFSPTNTTSAVQEANPYWNPNTQRWEMLFNDAGSQQFSYADHPLGPWASKVKVLGTGTGGEAGFSQQCSVFVENGFLYAFYITGNTQVLQLARSPLPTPAAPTPVFTKLGTVATSSLAAITGSPWVMKVDSTYYMFWERGGSTSLFLSSATSMDGLVATPFVETVAKLFLKGVVQVGAKVSGQRPQVFYEDGVWTMICHMTPLEFGACHGMRFTCNDTGGIPTNWTVAIDDQWLVRQQHWTEVDQIADVRLIEGPDGDWWWFWTAADNVSVQFCIIAAPAILPMLQYGSGEWTPVSTLPTAFTERAWINPDRVNGNTTIRNLWDVWVDTSGGAYTITLPRAASNARVRVHNDPASGQGNQLKIAASSTSDIFLGNNPITAMSAVGSTVTVTTKRPHGLTTTDLVTITGAAPTSYNIANAAVASVPAANQFTYTAGSSPAANTTLGFFARTSIEVGEMVELKCSTQFRWAMQ